VFSLGGINFQTMLNAYHGGWKLRAGPCFIKNNTLPKFINKILLF